jgi:hypothetical protein
LMEHWRLNKEPCHAVPEFLTFWPLLWQIPEINSLKEGRLIWTFGFRCFSQKLAESIALDLRWDRISWLRSVWWSKFVHLMVARKQRECLH